MCFPLAWACRAVCLVFLKDKYPIADVGCVESIAQYEGHIFYGTGSRSRNIFLEFGASSSISPLLFPVDLQTWVEEAMYLSSLSLPTLAFLLLPGWLTSPIFSSLFATRCFWEPPIAGAYGAALTAYDDSAPALASRISLFTHSSWASSRVGFQCARAVPLLEDSKDIWKISDPPSSMLWLVSFFQYPLACTFLLRSST